MGVPEYVEEDQEQGREEEEGLWKVHTDGVGVQLQELQRPIRGRLGRLSCRGFNYAHLLDRVS